MDYVVNQQPASASPLVAGGPGSYGSVTIRNMVPSDATFAGRMSVEAFRSKFEWAAGKRNFEGCVRAQEASYRSLPDEMMSRIFIAVCEGQPAGLIALRFRGDKAFEGTENRTFEEVGCCGTLGLAFMECIVSGEIVPVGTCYIDHICVDSQFRGRGIGKLLMERAEYEARNRQCRAMMLFVARDNRAVPLYERQGFIIAENEDGCLITWCAVGIRKWYKMEKPL